MRMTWVVALLIALAACAFSAEAPVVLYDSGHLKSRIVTSARATALETLAVQEINRTTRAIWGFELPVSDSGAAPELHNSIVIGTPDGNPVIRRLAASARRDFDWLGREGF